jgi:hypothetical protein
MENERLNILKHYLGTGLKMQMSTDHCFKKEGNKIVDFIGVVEYVKCTQIFYSIDGSFRNDYINYFKPCFLPISALTEKMEDGTIPVVELGKMRSKLITPDEIEKMGEKLKFDIDIKRLPFDMMEYLFAHHFNVFNLPEEEYIDKRTIKTK